MNISEDIKQLKTTGSKHLYPIDSKVTSEGHLIVGGCDVVELASTYGTPLYVIDEKTLKYKCQEYIDSLQKHYHDFLTLYAAKAFASCAIFKIVDRLGIGLDVVSLGELYLALKSNVNKKNIYLHGNNKSVEEIEIAIKNNIGKIVCDNFYELNLLQDIAKKLRTKVEILIRLTPAVECHTHEYIKTGHLDSKFGFDLEHFSNILNFVKTKGKNLTLKGIHAHIGSQIFELKPFADTINILLDQFQYAKEAHGIDLSELNIGGGIGIAYTACDKPITISDWAKTVTNTIKESCKKLNLKPPKLICEPGRSIIGPSGISVYRVGSTKQVPNGRKYIAVDGGMADNPRPITYQAKYTVIVANKMHMEDSSSKEVVTVAGKYCENGDLLVQDISLPKVEAGDIIVVLNTGAYNYSMSSNYNLTPRAACVLVNEGKADIIIKRENYEDLMSKHIIPTRFTT